MDEKPHIVLTQPDSFGRHWVYVSDLEVRGIPKGHFGGLIFLICVWFVAIGALEIVLGSSSSLPRMIYGLALFVTGSGLVLRNRLAYLASLFVPLIFLIRFFSLASSYGTASVSYGQFYDLFNAMVSILVCFYLFEGDRPNFIFRRRYRSYKSENAKT